MAQTPKDLFHTDYVNEDHIQDFSDALHSDDRDIEAIDASPTASNTNLASTPRVRKVSALSDFAPINVTLPKKRRHRIPKKRHDFMFHIIRWPLLILLFAYIYAIFGLYVLVRQIVNAFEWLFAWRGQKRRLRNQLRSARTYEEWKEVAKTMDQYLGLDEWKKEDRDPYYDWVLVHKVRRSLKSLREKDDARGILGVLETCIRANFAGTESAILYSQTYYGTKNCIEEYVNEVVSALEYVRETPILQQEEKRRFFKSANRNLGSSALCLSGGASFGYYHFGVIRALLDAKLIPRVVTGTSAGGLIAALVCTRSDEELKQLLVPQLAEKITACEEPFRVWFRRFLKTGARFDTVDWARKSSFFTRGSLTFLEAYQLTGRVLNISVIPFDRHSPTKLLNYLTAPNCVIWSALLASSAVPGILNPVVLMQKDKSGKLMPWNWGTRFRDGSLRVDIPIQSLNLLFNVNNPIVSQVNPHVHLWHFGPRGSAGKPVAHRRGKGWRGGFILSAAEQWLKLELTKNFKFMRDLELLPTLLGQDWSSVFLQRFEGVVTIWPRTTISDWFHILDDPSPQRLEEMIYAGQKVTWPRIHIIENRARIEKQIIKGRQAVRQPRPKDRALPDTLQARRSPAITPIRRSISPEMPIDSDAEAAFTQGSPRFFRSRSRRHSLSRTGSPHIQPSESTSDQGVTDPQDHDKPAVPEASIPSQPQTRASGIFSRFQKRSFVNLPSTLSGFGRNSAKFPTVDREDEAWSSDSSTSDYPVEDASIRARYPSIMGQ